MKNILTIPLLFLCGLAMGQKKYNDGNQHYTGEYVTPMQVKIGEISIDEVTAKAYFADCYLHPDTLKERNEHDYGIPNCSGCIIMTSDYNDAKLHAKEYNENLKRI